MTAPNSAISGLASGVQWRDLVDQIMSLEAQRRLDPVTARSSVEQKRLDAWNTWQSLVTKFRDATKSLRGATAFAQFSVSGGTSPVTGRPLVTASTAVGATPGTYAVEVLDVARANKLSSSVQAGASTALGLTGQFAINGRALSVVATDTLASLRDKVNALNTGASPSGVTASVLSSGAGQSRLILTADQAGASGIELVDDAAGTLVSLGLVDATKSANIDASGASRSHRVSAATATIAAVLGVTMPTPSTITVGGQTIAVDLTVDSLASIAAKIMAAGGTASVTSETVNGKTAYRLVTSGNVSASTADGLRTLEVLGFVRNGRSAIAQSVTSENAYTNGVGATATAGTLLTDLRAGGATLGVTAGDTIVIQGRRGDGSAVSVSFTVGGGDTLQTLLDKLNDATSGFGAGSRPATAAISGGQLVLTDGTGGDSQLSFAVTVNQQGGGVATFGRMLTTTVGRAREVTAGSDALVRIDGVTMQRPGNTITDAIAGVTLNVQAAEPGVTARLAIDRDSAAIVKTVSDLAAAYNDLVKFKASQAVAGAPLHNDPSLRAGMSSITSTLLSPVAGTTGTYTRPAIAGLALQRDGTLSLDANVFTNALTTSLADLTTLFSTGGVATHSDVSYFLSTSASKPGVYAIDITTASATASATGAGFSGTYVDDGTGDTITIDDAVSGNTANVSLDNGDTIDDIVSKLNSAFTLNKMRITASKSGNNLVLTESEYGSAATFTVAYTAGGTDGTGQLGLAAGTYAGVDVAGTIGGLAATGAGRELTGVAGGATEGLTISYTGAGTGNRGTINFVLGVSGMLYNAADLIGGLGGSVTSQQDVLQKRINDLRSRADTVQQTLDRRREALTKQFVEMERALSVLQQQSAALGSFITQLSASNAG